MCSSLALSIFTLLFSHYYYLQDLLTFLNYNLCSRNTNFSLSSTLTTDNNLLTPFSTGLTFGEIPRKWNQKIFVLMGLFHLASGPHRVPSHCSIC